MQGHPVCSFYTTYGSCRFGSSCKFDHPVISYYDYTLPEISAPHHFPPFPSQRNTPLTTLTLLESTSPKIMKSEARNEEAQPSDSDEYRNPSVPPTSPSHTALSSESLLIHSD